VLFCSTHLFRPPTAENPSSFYPGTGDVKGITFFLSPFVENTDDFSVSYPGGVFNVPLMPYKEGNSMYLRQAF